MHLGGIRENGEARTTESQILSGGIPRAEGSDGEAEREVADCRIRVVRKRLMQWSPDALLK